MQPEVQQPDPPCSSSSSFKPFFLSSGTPIEGVPEWRSKTPARTPGRAYTPMEGVPERLMQTGLRRSLQPTASAFAVTPMEGVPERALPYLATSSRLARLARLPMWDPSMLSVPAAAAEAVAAAEPMAVSARQEDEEEAEKKEEEEEPFICRAGDEVLRSESASPERHAGEGADREGTDGAGSEGRRHDADALQLGG